MPPNGGDPSISLAKRYLDSPLAFFLRTEGPARDPTWLLSLQTEALRMFMKHALDLHQGFYQCEIKGALANAGGERFSLDQFHKATRVQARFSRQFDIAFDSAAGILRAGSAGEIVAAQARADAPVDEAAAAEVQEKHA